MKQEELVKGLKYLGVVYSKEFTKIECEVYYDFLKEYTYDTFIKAIKSIVKKSKFLPKINELVDECENSKTQSRYEILDYMKSHDYFKDASEYDKAINYLTRNIIPDWFKKDMKKYYAMMHSERLEHKETLMIG